MVFIDFFMVWCSTLVFPSFFHSAAVPLTSPGRAGCWVASSKPVPAVQAVPAAWRTWGITGRFIVINQHQYHQKKYEVYDLLLSSIIIIIVVIIIIIICICICMMLLDLVCCYCCWTIFIHGGWSIFFSPSAILCEVPGSLGTVGPSPSGSDCHNFHERKLSTKV